MLSAIRGGWATIGLSMALAGCVAGTDGGSSHTRDTTPAPRRLVQASSAGADPVADLVPDTVADTAVIRGTGVPTAPDDTLGTRYGKHEGPARIIEPPDCRPSGVALCIADTASIAWSLPPDEEGGMPDERLTEWLVFAAEGDSMQVFVAGVAQSYLWMSPSSAAGFRAEHAINDASWIRARFGHAGTYVFSARVPSDAEIPYELRVAPVIATGASHPIGKSATLRIEADSSLRIAIAPAAMARGLDADSTWRPFAVGPGVYRMLLVRDTTYVACRLPCRSPRHFTARPAQAVTVRP